MNGAGAPPRRESVLGRFRAAGIMPRLVVTLLGVPCLYLITLRSRLMVDVANFLVKRRQRDLAFKLYRLSLAWWPDTASRLIVLTNMGAAELHGGQFDAAIQTLEGALTLETRGRLGLKYEAACHFNLGYAYERKGEDARAVSQYNEAIDVFPGSLYAKAAQAALERRKKKDSES